MDKKDICYKVIDHIMVIAHGESAPSKEGWNLMIEETQKVKNRYGKVRFVVWTSGGHPNATQRANLLAEIKDLDCRAAVITESSLARRAVTAFSYMSPSMNIKAFDPKDEDVFSKVIDHLREDMNSLFIEEQLGNCLMNIGEDLPEGVGL
ncbi:MAG: hypothetical protein MJA83_04145 [Gammaproteobacteria bacterium]|nr:hypothetical protein [Gammaproteobacteria bacterium]